MTKQKKPAEELAVSVLQVCSAVVILAWIALLVWVGVSELDIDDVITSI